MSNIAQFMGGSGGGYQNIKIFSTSATFTTPVAGKYKIWAMGGGGAGAVGGSGEKCVTGGGGGGFCLSEYFLPASSDLTITIGAGGIKATVSASAGPSGSNTTVSGALITTMIAGGGGGGAITSGAACNGGTGGTATGGNLRNTIGGNGGNISAQTQGINCTGGGGAGTIYGNGGRGGNITYTQPSNSYSITGGGGVLGRGGDLSISTGYTQGGTAYANAIDGHAGATTPGAYGALAYCVEEYGGTGSTLYSHDSLTDYGFSPRIFGNNLWTSTTPITGVNVSPNLKNPLAYFMGSTRATYGAGVVASGVYYARNATGAGGSAGAMGSSNYTGGGGGTCAGAGGWCIVSGSCGPESLPTAPTTGGRGAGGGGFGLLSGGPAMGAACTSGGSGLVVIEW